MNLPSPENPITITLEVTSVNQLLGLWHRLDASENEINLLAEAGGFNYKYNNKDVASWHWWDIINKVVCNLNLEDQL